MKKKLNPFDELRQAKRQQVKLTLTTEEKTRWKPILQRTWNAIAYDVIQVMGGEAKRRDVIEFTCDADRPRECWGNGSSMTKEEYRVLRQLYDTVSFRRWIKEEVFPCDSYVI